MNPSSNPRQRIIVAIVIVAVAIFGYLTIKPAPTARPLELGESTIYYKGPMRGRGGQKTMGSDELNPDIEGGDPNKVVPAEKKKP